MTSEHIEPITMILPDEPPELTPAAARALLRLLLDADARLHGAGGEQPGQDPAGTVEP